MTREELAERLDSIRKAAENWNQIRLSDDKMADLRAAAAALREPVIRFRWEAINETESHLYVRHLLIGRLSYGPDKWFAQTSAKEFGTLADTETDARRALEAHVLAQIGGRPPPDLSPLVRKLVGALTSLKEAPIGVHERATQGELREARDASQRADAALTAAAAAGYETEEK